MKRILAVKLSIMMFVSFLCSIPAFAGVDPAPFLNIGVGARALGMGGAYTAISNDSTAMYWNPAGLAKVNKLSFTGMGQSLGNAAWETQKDITPNYQFIGITFPFKQFGWINWLGTNNTFGVGLISNSLANISYTSVDSSGKIVRDTFEDLEKAYYVSYGFSLLGIDSISVGGTFKYITQEFTKIQDATASGYDFEAGMMYDLDEKTTLGVVMKRGVEIVWANGRKDSSALTTKFGLARRFNFLETLSLLGSADLVQNQNQPIFGYFGTELAFEPDYSTDLFGMEGLYVRFGLDGTALENRFDYQTKINNNLNYTAGLGIKVSYLGYAMKFDYVMGSYRLGDKNRFSVSFYF